MSQSPSHQPATVAAIDLGGTKIAAALVAVEGETPTLLSTHHTPTPRGADTIIDAILNLVATLRADASALATAPPTAVGIGSAGVIDPTTGDVVDATESIPGWKGTPLGRRVAEGTGLPTFVDNDVHAHALGEMWLGAGEGLTDFAVVAVGTGVGITLVLDGRIRPGRHRLAGNGAAIEPISAGPAVAAAYNHRAGTDLTLHQIAAHLDTDHLAREVIAASAHHLGTCLGHLVNAVDPEAIVLGGGVPGIGAAWREPMEAALRATSHPALRGIEVLDAQLGTEAALFGAAKLALNGTHS
ncbi:ROK family protein [Micrococcales bacterium 31B]|nr:ROK family protein [Micrococcales bacterium 31B]